MSRPRRTTSTDAAEGKVAGIEHIEVRMGTATYGDDTPEPVEKASNDNLPKQRISVETKTAIMNFLDAFKVDVVAERQRIADHLKAEADRALAAAEEAAQAMETSS